MPLPDYYATLQIDPTAGQDMIDAAYRRLAARFHPDVAPSRGAAERMRIINEAYHVLSNPERRRAYDLLRGTPLRPPVPPAANADLGRPAAERPALAETRPIVCASCGRRLHLPLQARDAYNCPHCGRRYMTLLGPVHQVHNKVERGLVGSRRLYRLVLALPEGRQLVQFEAPRGEPLPLRQNEMLLLHFDLSRQLVLIQNLTSRRLYRLLA